MASNLEIVRQYFEPFNGVDFKAPVEAAIATRVPGEEAAVMVRVDDGWAGVSPDIVWDTSPIAGEGLQAHYAGHSEFLDFWGEWLSVWDEYIYDVVEYVDRGASIVARVDVKATGRAGLAAAWQAGQVCEVADGQIVRMCVYPSMAEALEAV